MTAPRIPVIVGVGQLANKDEDRIVHPIVLLEEAVARATTDSGAGRRILEHVGLIMATPLSVFTNENAAELIAARLGITGATTVESTYSGAAPQRLLATACRAIADGETEAALLVGGVADASVRRARLLGEEPPSPPTAMWSQGSNVSVPDELGLDRVRPGFPSGGAVPEIDAGGRAPVHFFALIESAFAHSAGRDPAAQRQHLGQLLAPFTEAASRRPDVSWFPQPRTGADIAEIRPDNRLIAEPYTKLMCSFPTVDLAASVLVCSADLADRLGVPAHQRVHPWAVTSVKDERMPSRWERIDRSAGMTAAVNHALSAACLDADQLGAFDLYSCFPAAVQLALAAFGIPADDSRPFSLTGGLPYLGGPGASYSLHGIVAMAEHCRTEPDLVGAVVGIGGMANDSSVGLYSSAAPETPFPVTDPLPPAESGATSIATVASATGRARVEAMTVVHASSTGPEAAPVIAALPSGERVGATASSPELVAELSGRSLVGHEVLLVQHDGHSTYTTI
jgi:acetyl-CoA C-acetyltransferase